MGRSYLTNSFIEKYVHVTMHCCMVNNTCVGPYGATIYNHCPMYFSVDNLQTSVPMTTDEVCSWVNFSVVVKYYTLMPGVLVSILVTCTYKHHLCRLQNFTVKKNNIGCDEIQNLQLHSSSSQFFWNQAQAMQWLWSSKISLISICARKRLFGDQYDTNILKFLFTSPVHQSSPPVQFSNPVKLL